MGRGGAAALLVLRGAGGAFAPSPSSLPAASPRLAPRASRPEASAGRVGWPVTQLTTGHRRGYSRLEAPGRDAMPAMPTELAVLCAVAPICVCPSRRARRRLFHAGYGLSAPQGEPQGLRSDYTWSAETDSAVPRWPLTGASLPPR